MSYRISHRAKAIKPSPTLTVDAMAKEMKSRGINVINFGVGEPDFNTPDFIKEEAKTALDNNFTRYTDTAGILELRKEITNKLLRDNGLEYTPDQILVSAGAKASIMFSLMTICDMRDEVLIPTPYWVSYTSQVEMVDGLPVLLPTGMADNFKINPDQLEDAILSLSNPKAVIINSPNNPTGAVYTKEELEKIAEVCLKHNIIIISDEIYEKLIYDNEKHISIASLSKEVKDMTIVINGVSKAYAMTGWRLGYAAGPKDIIKSAGKIQGHTTSSVNSMAQKATVVALKEGDASIEIMRLEFEKRRNFLIERLNKIRNVKCNVPKGAFYAMPDVSFYLRNNKKGIKNSTELCEYLLKEYHIAIVSGTAFGADDYVRFSYANSMENLKQGMDRFEEGLTNLLV